MSSTTVNVVTKKAVKAAGKKVVKAELVIEPEVVIDEEEEAVRVLAEIRAKKAQKAIEISCSNQLTEYVEAYKAERKTEIIGLKAKIEEFQSELADSEEWLADAENGYADKMILERAVAKQVQEAQQKAQKPVKTKTGKTVIPIKSGEVRAEAVMGKGVMREQKLKSLIKSKGAKVRWVSKGTKGLEYGVYKGDICSRDNSQVVHVFLMPIWTDLVKELGFEKGMTLALFKQQLSTQ